MYEIMQKCTLYGHKIRIKYGQDGQHYPRPKLEFKENMCTKVVH